MPASGPLATDPSRLGQGPQLLLQLRDTLLALRQPRAVSSWREHLLALADALEENLYADSGRLGHRSGALNISCGRDSICSTISTDPEIPTVLPRISMLSWKP